MSEYDIPTDAELDQLLVLPLHQRGERLLAMTPTRRIAYAVAYARRAGSMPYRVLDQFEQWKKLHLDTMQRA